MKEKQPSRELIQTLIRFGLLAVGIYASLNAFTKSQREWLDRRDQRKCQAFWPHECNGVTQPKRQKHHILSQRYCKELGINPDFALNGITLCENAHVGNGHDTGDVIHPDMRQARLEYRAGNKGAYQETFERREQLIKEKIIYWNDKYDRGLHALAAKNTQRFEEPWPEKRNGNNS